jgi:hypothetical protein
MAEGRTLIAGHSPLTTMHCPLPFEDSRRRLTYDGRWPMADLPSAPGWRLTQVLFKVRNGMLPLEMLEMKIDPAMCMKTQAKGQNVHPKNGLFTRKCTHCTIIDKIWSGLLAENAKITR